MPAGVPVVVLVELLELQPAWKITSEKKPANRIVISTRRRRDFPPIPTRKIANPATGNNAAYRGLPVGKRLAGVVTRAVVLTTSWRLCGPLLRLVKLAPLGKVAVPPLGAPAAETVTVSGIFPLGVTVTV